MNEQSTAYNDYYKGKRVLVTGGAGFIGKNLIRELQRLGAEVEVFDLKQGLDVRNSSHLTVVFESFKPETVFHLAAQTEVGDSMRFPERTYRTNVLGTLNVLEACKRFGVARLIYSSTDKVYGPQLDPPEEGDRFARSPHHYGESKRIADELCENYQSFHKLPVRVLRLVNTYGPGQVNETTLITGSVMKLLRGEPPVLSTPEVKREWLYIDDAVRAFLLVGAVETYQWVFNVGSGERRYQGEVLGEILKRLEITILRDYPVIPSPISDYSQHVASAKFRCWFPEWNPVPFSEGITKTVEWYKEMFAKGGVK